MNLVSNVLIESWLNAEPLMQTKTNKKKYAIDFLLAQHFIAEIIFR